MNLQIPKLSVDCVFEGDILLVEWNDGSLSQYRFEEVPSWRRPNLRWLKPDEIAERVHRHNLAERPCPSRSYHPPSSIAGAAFWRP